MATTADDLLGTWLKATRATCAQRYPPEIELRRHETYDAPAGPTLGSLWHGGTWNVHDGDVLVMQAANDAELRYRIVEADETTLTIVDDEDCQVTYRRA